VRHVKLTLSCEHCRNSSAEIIRPVGKLPKDDAFTLAQVAHHASHVARYYAHHAACGPSAAEDALIDTEQLEDIGNMLVRARIITKAAVRKSGVRFAVRHRFEPNRL